MLTSKKGEEIVTQEKKGATKTQICFVFMLSILGGISIWVKYSEEYNQSGKYTPLIFFAIVYCFITAGFLLRKVIKAFKERKNMARLG